ncbi:MAG: hypothetical protein ACPGXK_01880 [Phycisphaerae bacterium]
MTDSNRPGEKPADQSAAGTTKATEQADRNEVGSARGESSRPLDGPRAIHLHDHKPGILAGFPAVVFVLLTLLALPQQLEKSWAPVSLHMLFWIGLSTGIFWYIALRFNLTQKRFFLVFGLAGTFVGIPAALELAGIIQPFQWIGRQLGALKPEVNAGAWFVLALVFAIVWLVNFVWSRTHLRVRLDENGMYVSRLGAKTERYDLIGLKTETEPVDYAETFLAGIGSLAIKTRTGKEIFRLDRVVNLYRIPWFPFFRGKHARVLDILSYSGKVTTVPADRAELMAAEAAAEMADHEDDFVSDDHDADLGESPREIK